MLGHCPGCWGIAPAIDIGYVLFCRVAFCLSWLGFMFGLPWGVPLGVLVGVVDGLLWCDVPSVSDSIVLWLGSWFFSWGSFLVCLWVVPLVVLVGVAVWLAFKRKALSASPFVSRMGGVRGMAGRGGGWVEGG